MINFYFFTSKGKTFTYFDYSITSSSNALIVLKIVTHFLIKHDFKWGRIQF